jgi:nucleotide-binding universal stress UspA family protein
MAGKILVTLDGSQPAENAARVAVQIASKKGDQVLGLYIVDEALVMNAFEAYMLELGQDRGMPASRQELIEWFETKGSELLAGLESLCYAANVSIQTQIIFGGVPDIMQEQAEEADLLAIGRRGNVHDGKVGHLGNHFLQVGHRVPTPILVGGEIVRPIQKVFLIADESGRKKHAFNWGAWFRQAFSAELIIATPPNFNIEKALAEIEPPLRPDDYRELILDSDMPEAFISSLLDSQADLVITGGFRYPEILEWLVDGQTDQLLQNSQIPALLA